MRHPAVVKPASCALAAWVVAAALSGCGGDSSRDEAAIRRAIHGAVRAAVVNRDARSACAYATPAGVRRLLHWYRLSYARRFRDCEQVVRFELRQQADAVIPNLRRTLAVVGSVRVDGAKATARVTDEKGEFPDWRHVSLRKLNGRWLIDDSDVIPHGM